MTEEDLREAEAWAAPIAQKYGAADLRGTLAQSVLTLVAEVREYVNLLRGYHLLADHLLLMHRRENRVMEGGEDEILRLRELWKQWPASVFEEWEEV